MVVLNTNYTRNKMELYADRFEPKTPGDYVGTGAKWAKSRAIYKYFAEISKENR